MSIANINISQDIYEMEDHELLCLILLELRKLNTQLELITDNEINEEDTR